MPGVFPDYPAPVIRNTGAGTEMVTMRWGMPPPPRTGGPPVTNIRNTSSPHWRMWLKPENRCLVPANSFAEPNPETKKDVVWFALNEDRPLFAFAGTWTTFNGDRGTKSKPSPTDCFRVEHLTDETRLSPAPLAGRGLLVQLHGQKAHEWPPCPDKGVTGQRKLARACFQTSLACAREICSAITPAEQAALCYRQR